MVRKSKRKQAVVPFERSNDAVHIELTHCTHLLTLDASDADTFILSNVLRSLKECGSVLQQTKVLQENKTYFKSILGKTDESGSRNTEQTKKVTVNHNMIFNCCGHIQPDKLHYITCIYIPIRQFPSCFTFIWSHHTSHCENL